MKVDMVGNSVAVGGYEYLIFDTIAGKLKLGTKISNRGTYGN